MRDLYDRFKEPGEHQKVTEVVGGWTLTGFFTAAGAGTNGSAQRIGSA